MPDVMFFRAERFARYKETTPDWDDKPFVIVPDLAIEVVSPNDRFSLINKKVNQYLADGVELVWVIDPQEQNIYVHRKGQTTILSGEDTLNGGSVLKGLNIKLTNLFTVKE